MTTTTLAGATVDRNDEGFFADPDQWTEAMAPELAAAEGIDELTEAHWRVIKFMRTEYAAKGTGPDRPGPRQDLRRVRQGALPALPQGPGEDRSQDRRHPQAPRLHLKGGPPWATPPAAGPDSKVSIVISKGSLEGIYPGLIMANGARAEGIEANLFFTFFGLDAIHQARHDHIKLATVGNPGLHLPRGGLPGVSWS